MHFLLIPYLLLSLIFLSQFQHRNQATARGGVVLIATLTGLMMYAAMLFRPVHGDSWRYYVNFRYISSRSLEDALALPEADPLFSLLNWLAGQLGETPPYLFGATLTIYFAVLILALRRQVGPLGASVLIMCYAAFPYFVAYGASGLRQGLALVFLFMAYTHFQQGRRTAWVWLLISPFWHSGAWLAVGVFVLHVFMCKFVKARRARWQLVMGSLLVAIGLSATGLNETLLSSLPDSVQMKKNYEIYFTDAREVGYEAGFRIDFLAFSLVPLAVAWLLPNRNSLFSYTASGWWLSLYLSLNVIYHLFSFAPFADRFAAFSWFLMPLVVFIQIRDTAKPKLMSAFVIGVSFVNLAMLQFYTGRFLGEPVWW